MFALGWNVYRDVILKPRVKVSVAKATLIMPHGPNTDHLTIKAVNHGPGQVRLNTIRFKRLSLFGRLLKRSQYGVIVHDYENPLSGTLPKMLEVGDTLSFFFPWDRDSFLSSKPTHLGLDDTFGRFHWASKRELKTAYKEWKKAFPPTS